jgi:hypothetical protein
MYPADPRIVAVKTGAEMHVKPSLNEVIDINPDTNGRDKKSLDVEIGDQNQYTSGDKYKDQEVDHDNGSIYGDGNNEEEDRDELNNSASTRTPKKMCSPLSCAALSYADIASLNPYIDDVKALNWSRIAFYPPTEEELRVREDRHREDLARLAWELDNAHAAIVREQFAALQALKRQIQLPS